MKKLISLLLAAVICLTLIQPGVAFSAAVKLNKTKLTLDVGKTFTLRINSTATVKWSTSSKAIASVSSKGKVTAKSKGTATIIATVSKKQYKCKVTVKDPEVDVIFSAFILDDTTIDEYIKEVKKAYPDYISVKKYDDEHYIARMYESYRISLIEAFNQSIKPVIAEYINSPDYDGLFTDVTYDKLFTKATVYVAKDKYNELDGLTVIYYMAYISDYYQSINLVDIDDRSIKIEVIDNKTNDIIYNYDSKEEKE